MAHYAELNPANEVIKVHRINNEVIIDSESNEQEQLGINFLTQLHGGVGWYKQTSYNGNFRKNYAGIGFIYDTVKDAFIAPQPYLSWSLNETTCRWEAPVPYPDDGKEYMWDEEVGDWAILEEIP